MHRWSPLIVVLVSSVALAGCIGGDPQPTPGSDPPATSDSTGALRGKVLDSGLDPVSGALVGLLDGDALVGETRTEADGAYTIGDLAPGTYRLQVTALCCRATVRSVTVVADEVQQIDVQLVALSSDDLQEAYVYQQEWNGFISCGLSTIAARAAACALMDDTPAEDANEEFLIEFNVSKGIKTLVVGMDWDPVGGVSGQTFNLLIENDDCGFDACSYRYADLEGEPPLMIHIGNGEITDDAYSWDAVTGERGLQFRVFAGGDASLVYQQPFRVYYHAFYWEPAPSDYNPIPDQ